MIHKVSIMLLLTICVSLTAISYSYDSLNRLELVTYVNGYSVQYVYDNHGNIISMTHTIPNAAPNSPQSVVVSFNSSNQAVLSWDSVTENVNGTAIVVQLYRIESCDTPDGVFVELSTSSQTTYTDINPTTTKRFYRIKAVINED